MNAVELIREGRLAEARTRLAEDLRGAPADPELRALLFKVLAFAGEWDKALKHLDMLELQCRGTLPQVEPYRSLVAAERARAEVQAGRRVPDFLSDPPVYLQDFLAARQALAAGDPAPLAALLPVLEESLGSLSGTFNGEPFGGVLDPDATLIPFLEVFIHDQYLWFPFSAIRELTLEPPATLLDLLWTPARLVTWDGLTTECILPVLYPGSAGHADDAVRLGRRTEWQELCGSFCRGFGQHLFLFGDEEKGILEIREVVFAPPKES
ncbi:tetratricopeptide repeat protein [Geomonas sp. RF6]|uniref:type VI secretion system accessory protein TagJ n=1 Tax=Geomonas sp. RF6 TaxID=2897342 RepID=UPI001E29C4D9|nr:type VI secretion system accessory protein TagJ [Geomonas sp. RF6]UFS70720.1 tetratricopeptide repeat protein [Geomonas sp. RF6]